MRKSFFNNLEVALKVLALSDTMSGGVPLLEQKRLKQFTNVDANRSGTSSRCTALVTQHVNNAMYDLTMFPFEALTYNGPAKSTPTLLKRGAWFTLKSSRAAVGGAL